MRKYYRQFFYRMYSEKYFTIKFVKKNIKKKIFFCRFVNIIGLNNSSEEKNERNSNGA
jgi:hypothetical protein